MQERCDKFSKPFPVIDVSGQDPLPTDATQQTEGVIGENDSRRAGKMANSFSGRSAENGEALNHTPNTGPTNSTIRCTVGLNLYYHNIHSIGNKLNNVMKSDISACDMFLLTEIWLSPEISSNLLTPIYITFTEKTDLLEGEVVYSSQLVLDIFRLQ